MAQRSGFDMSKLSTASKILLGAGVLYFIDLFLPWNRACVGLAGFNVCGSASGLHGIGILNLLLVLGLMGVEAATLAGVTVPSGSMISAALAGGIVVFTLIKILVDNTSLYLFAFVGIILALVLAYGGWMRWQEGNVSGSAGGGTTSSGGSGFTT